VENITSCVFDGDAVAGIVDGIGEPGEHDPKTRVDNRKKKNDFCFIISLPYAIPGGENGS
jgi:hypothetical protein